MLILFCQKILLVTPCLHFRRIDSVEDTTLFWRICLTCHIPETIAEVLLASTEERRYGTVAQPKLANKIAESKMYFIFRFLIVGNITLEIAINVKNAMSKKNSFVTMLIHSLIQNHHIKLIKRCLFIHYLFHITIILKCIYISNFSYNEL